MGRHRRYYFLLWAQHFALCFSRWSLFYQSHVSQLKFLKGSKMICIILSIMPLQQSDSLGLVVISEEDTHRTLLIHRIVFDDIYYRQGGMVQPDDSPLHHFVVLCAPPC